jgi:hypothetical protein
VAFAMDEIWAYNGQLLCNKEGVVPIALGVGERKIKGSGYVEGPFQVGNPSIFPSVYATLMVGPTSNSNSPRPSVPGSFSACGGVNNSPYSLAVIGDACVFNNFDVSRNIVAGSAIRAGGNITAQGEVTSQCGVHRLSNKKNFDIPHPSKEGYRLRHTCPEAPYNDVYIRGKVKNKTEIELPSYWKDFVDIQSITVSLTPIGAHQNVIVKRIDENKVYLQANGGIPINCFYHIFAERKDGEKLIPEYQGKGPQDYPGDNNEYSVAGYHYDTKEDV